MGSRAFPKLYLKSHSKSHIDSDKIFSEFFLYEIQILFGLFLNTAMLCVIHVVLILCINKYTPNIIFVFLIVMGSAKAPMKVQGFGTPKKV